MWGRLGDSRRNMLWLCIGGGRKGARRACTHNSKESDMYVGVYKRFSACDAGGNSFCRRRENVGSHEKKPPHIGLGDM